MYLAYRAPAANRRSGLLLTVLVHVALLLGWQVMRTLPAPASLQDDKGSRTVWIPLPQKIPRPAAPDKAPAPPRRQTGPTQPHVQNHPLPAPAIAQAGAPVPAASAATEAAPAQPIEAEPNAQEILERAKRDVKSIAKSLRKENNPYIAAPLDSPQIRLQRGIEQANAMAPNRIWEAPKVEELVNNTGDGARRSRVITGGGTYCVTERATNTSIDMIEKHGKLRFTSCPEHEEPAKQQAWRTLRD
jgi:hypothetical protein